MTRKRLAALLLSIILVATAAYAGTNVTFNGVSYTIPAVGDAAWGTNVTNYLIALSTGTFQKTGGLFTLTNEANFGATYGLNSAYFKSRTTNAASTGAVRLANTDSLSWRNAGNTGDLALGATTAGVAYNNVVLADVSTAQTLTNKTLTQPIISTISNAGVLTLPTGTDNLVSRTSTDTLTNKTLTAPAISTISNSGTLTLPTGTLTLATLTGAETLTNKTITQPVIATVSNAGVVTLPSGTRTLVARDTTDTLTNKTLTAPAINAGTLSALTGFALRDTSAAFDVTVAATSSTTISAGRTLTVDMQDASNTIKIKPLSLFSTAADGSAGTVLTTSGSGVGYYWTAPLVNPMTTKGDLVVGGSAGAANRLGVGSNGQILTASSAATFGVAYQSLNLASGGGMQANIGQIAGTTTNDNACVGCIGEYVENLRSSNINIATGSAVIVAVDSGNTTVGDNNEVGITLTAGDWDIQGSVYLVPVSVTSFTDFGIWIGTAKGNSTTNRLLYRNYTAFNFPTAPTASHDLVLVTPVWRQSITSPTTYYLKCQPQFGSATTLNAQGELHARRVR